MTLECEKFKEAIKTDNKLGMHAEFLSMLENIVEIAKINVEGCNVEFTKAMTIRQKELRDLCENIYNHIRDFDNSANLERLVDELEVKYKEFEKEVTNANIS